MAKCNVDLLVVRAGEMVTCRGPATGIRGEGLGQLHRVADGALAVSGERIAAVGTTEEILDRFEAARVLDARGALVSPAFVDPHSHLVYGGTRHQEYEAKVTRRASVPGLDSGIRYTVRKTREAPDEALVGQALADLDVMLAHGTTTLEAKTGYGLEPDAELRLLRLTAGLKHHVDVVPTYLPLHVLPEEYAGRRAEYLQIISESLVEAATLADYCDVTCDPIGFTFEECLEVGEAARGLGMRIRVHADQFGDARGALLAACLGASAADHLDYASDEGLKAMAQAGTVATLLPGVALHLMEITEKPFLERLARRAIEAGCVLALSTDYNPGSCPMPSMQTAMQLAARIFRLGYAEIWNMATLNAARALDLAHDRGSLEPGKRADVLVWSVPSHGLAINRFGVNLVDTVIVAGRVAASASPTRAARSAA
jgi:imidazolonepropionase